MPADEWISIKEAAALLGLTTERVRQMAHAGVLTAKRLHARAILVSRQSVARNLAEYEAGRDGAGRPRERTPAKGATGHEAQEMRRVMKKSSEIEITDLVTGKTAAEISGYNRGYLYNLLDAGKLSQVHIDGVAFFIRSQVEAIGLRRSPAGRPRKTKGV